ncbi:flagellar biosynthesis repressor FlbT [Erythrobacter aureus]|uniref:Flagellar biosynthesis repressor FlbT n=1 Tax=Erythrobacter aureus TaxID=2182384 RepID=A0A345YJN1_9SPHN|nr:flagellar biosynthesis repressor FlbT [Erythrobacter aureus]AXK44133.1 flagellar biosynthesis repressor FlbT [Erythrobacter aureus]
MLRISLKDQEKIIINGAIIRSAGKSTLMVENRCTILRGKDIMEPEEANTPTKRLYFACMMAYLDPENREQHQDSILDLYQPLMGIFQSGEPQVNLIEIGKALAISDFYKALTECRQLIDYEAEAMNRAAPADAD